MKTLGRLKKGKGAIFILLVALCLIMATQISASEDSISYLNPFGIAGRSVSDSSSSAIDTQVLQKSVITEPNISEIARQMMAEPGKTQSPITLTVFSGNLSARQNEPLDSIEPLGTTFFREAHIDGEMAGEPTLGPRGARAEIPLAERFVTRSLDRNTAVIVLYVDGGGQAQFDWSQEELENTAEGTVNMLVDVLNMAHSYSIDMTLWYVPSFVQIESEPILNGSGVVYGSADAWEEGDLDPWRSEVIGNVVGPHQERYTPNLRGLFDYIADISAETRCSQVATIFVINADTVKYHSTGKPPNWAAEWDFDTLYSKPYCTVERTGTTMNENNFRYVAMHELFHLFGAADEYDGSSDCVDPANCGLAKYGMLKVPNDNCPYCADLNQDPCVMDDPINHHTVCWYTRRMLGWLDPDGNGGGLVDDMPVDFTALVAGDFNFGDFFEVRTLDGDFINAFRVSSYNSYPRPDGKRTIQVLGMNYKRDKIAPDIYYGSVNGGPPFTFTLSLNNDHPPLTITDYLSHGPYFKYTLNYVGHSNMGIRNPYTGEWWQVYTGELLAGQNTLVEFLWKGWDWVKDGSYTNENLGWVCDGVNKPLTDSAHLIAYGPPSNWDMQSINYIPDSDRVVASWSVGSWSENAWVMQNSDTVTSLSTGYGYGYGASWYNPIGSDSCNVYIAAFNPNGSSHSDTMAYLTEPNTPQGIQFSDVYQTVCQPIPDNTVPINDPKYNAPCVTASHKINAIAVFCDAPTPQRIENISGYLIRLGHYIEEPPGSNNYIWQDDSAFLEDANGSLADTIDGLDPGKEYSANIFTIDRFGQASPWGLPIYQNIIVGEMPWNESNPPTEPSGNAGKLGNLPTTFGLENYPNPFNPATVINYALPRKSSVSIDIFNILGQKVTTLVEGEKPAGNHSVLWGGADQAGHLVSSGIYFYRLKTGEFAQTRKMLLLK